MIQKQLGEKIKKLRQQVNMSQDDFAKALNVSRVTFSQIEQGERELKHSELIRLADIFEIDVNELLTTSSSKKEKKINKKDKHYKLKQIILYLSFQLINKQNFGETVLNKLLYFIDFDYYERTGSLITDEEYVKLPYGPVPRYIKEVIEDMQEKGQIQIITREYFGKTQKTIIPLIGADIEFLSTIDKNNHQAKSNYTPHTDLPHPQNIINEVIEKYGSRNAEALSDWSHNDMPYKATKKIGEIISPGLVFYRTPGYITNHHNLSDNNE